MQRADAGLELLLTDDRARAARGGRRELDLLQPRPPDAETRILFAAEAAVRAAGSRRAAIVLAAEGWHPGVIGIVAVADRRAPPPARAS